MHTFYAVVLKECEVKTKHKLPMPFNSINMRDCVHKQSKTLLKKVHIN